MTYRLAAMGAVLLCAVSSADATIDNAKLVDLTYPLDEHTVFWPTNKPFRWTESAWGRTAGGYWYASGEFSMSEHGGTHIDAPIHFAEGRLAVDEIPLTQLVAPAVVIDVRQSVAGDRDYRLTLQDIERWEQRHGPIAPGSIVLMWSGWGQHWPDPKRYLGSETPGDATTLHFPGFSQEAAKFLTAKRQVAGIGVDTASIDYGQSADFIVHQVINGANRYGLENVAHLDALPPRGATLIALPIKIKRGTGGPVRIIAVLP